MRQLAHRLADDARGILTDNFRTSHRVQYKTDGTPVTTIDTTIERHLRTVIEQHAPHCGIIGEEEPPHNEHAQWLFVCDPLDGTLPYISGKPLFGFLLAILHQRLPLYGIIDSPITQERWHGGDAFACQHNGAPTRTHDKTSLANAILHATSPHMFLSHQESAFHRLRAGCRSVIYGSDCYAYGLLASGFADVIAEATMKPADFLALAPIITSAGGVISDWHGRTLTLDSDGTVLAAASTALHRQALTLLNGHDPVP